VILLWLFTGLVLVFILRQAAPVFPAFRWQWVLLFACSVVLLWLYFRPHNDIIAGQDGPAYLNCGIEYAEHGSLGYTDAMLNEVDPALRSQFLYYHHKSAYLTKFGSLYLADMERAHMQTWFQVAPSLILAAAAKCFGSRSVLYVIPLFGLLNGLVMAFLAMSVLGRSRITGLSAALFYWLNPLIIWHARVLRAEFMASFMLWSGIALLISAMKERKSIALWLVGSMAVNLAPFFHITSAMVVLPFSVVVALFVLKGNRLGLIFGAVQSLFAALFALQTLQFSDPYHLSRYLQAVPYGTNRWIFGIICLAGWLGLGGLSILLSKHIPDIGGRLRSSLRLRLSAAAVVLAVLAGILWHVHHTPAAEFKSLVYHYYYRTDLRSVTRLFSLPAVFCGLFGLILILVRGGSSVSRRFLFCMVVLPAALGVGNMYDFFTTRYLIVAMIPLLTLSLTEVVRWIGDLNLPIPYRRTASLLLFLVFLLHGRLLLIRHIDRAGLYDNLEQVADVLNSDNGILLCEYSRVAGALEHIFGVPTLGLDGEELDSYRNIEKEWRRIMEKMPGRSAYYITPFNSFPRSSSMDFEFVRKFRLDSSVLVDRRWDLPVETRKWGLSLYLYKISLSKKAVISNAEFSMSPGNMGFSRFSGCRMKKGVSVSGAAITKDKPLVLNPSTYTNAPDSELWLILHHPGSGTNSLPQYSVGCFVPQGGDGRPKKRDLASMNDPLSKSPDIKPMGNGWFLLRVSGKDISNGVVILFSDKTIVTQAFSIDGGSVADADELLHDFRMVTHKLDPYVARWARQNAALTLPQSGEKGAVMLLFMTPPSEVGGSVNTTMTAAGKSFTTSLATGSWRWSAIAVEAGADTAELKFTTEAPFDPHMSGFDQDLILFMGYGNFIQR